MFPLYRYLVKYNVFSSYNGLSLYIASSRCGLTHRQGSSAVDVPYSCLAVPVSN